jgi:hypothetical protein
VDAGFLTEARYQELMFQENPNAPAREWQYYKPTSSVSPALFSGRPVTIWNCPLQTYIAGHADGSAVLFGPEKLPHYRSKLDASQLSE